jgi:hypothetical protein
MVVVTLMDKLQKYPAGFMLTICIQSNMACVTLKIDIVYDVYSMFKCNFVHSITGGGLLTRCPPNERRRNQIF